MAINVSDDLFVDKAYPLDLATKNDINIPSMGMANINKFNEFIKRPFCFVVGLQILSVIMLKK